MKLWPMAEGILRSREEKEDERENRSIIGRETLGLA